METADAWPFGVSQARALVAAGFRALEERKQEINDLNVYPVPDGDTGTNLSLTVKNVLDDLLSAPDDLGPKELAASITESALMGARGNSGVILSQMGRGALEVLGEGKPITPAVLASAFRRATEVAYRAVRRPVEGTMLTVMREMAEAAELSLLEDREDSLLESTLAAGRESVRRTPLLLKTLADAGVVDAGGYGLVVLLAGMLSEQAVASIVEAAAQPELAGAALAPAVPRAVAVEPESKFAYCTSLLLRGSGLEVGTLEESLNPLGDSLLVVGVDTQMKVHIHTDDPGAVLSLVLTRGTLHEIEIDNMREQTAARDQRLRQLEAESAHPVGLTQVVAVVSGEGNRELFRSLGADLLVEGGQTMNPSAEELLQAAKRASAPAVVILPNNPNIIMTAEQIVHLEDREIHVVPTRSIPAGLAAMVAFNPEASGSENAAEMEDALQGLSTGELTRAVRDSTVEGIEVKEGTYIGLVNEKLVAAAFDLEEVVEKMAERLIGDDKEVITVLVGDGEGAQAAAAATLRLKDRYPDVEVEVYEGGQPLYPLLLSAE